MLLKALEVVHLSGNVLNPSGYNELTCSSYVSPQSDTFNVCLEFFHHLGLWSLKFLFAYILAEKIQIHVNSFFISLFKMLLSVGICDVRRRSGFWRTVHTERSRE